MRKKQLRIISLLIIAYMLIAFLWWSILLHRNNVMIYSLKKENLISNDEGLRNLSDESLLEEPEFKALYAEYNRQTYMIVGEAVVFGLTLALGIYFVNRALIKELKVAERQKNFLLSITHELKSPLASINLILDTFIKRDLDRDKVKELSQDAIGESKRLEELFNKILLATRLGTAHQYHFVDTEIISLTTHMVESFKKLNPEITISFHHDKEIICHIDEEAYKSVIMNLLENASKYSLSPKIIDITAYNAKESCKITIADNGIGIPHDEKSKVYDQFYRIGSEDTRKTKGTGLGLYIVNEIINAHHGKIKIKDNTPSGAIFNITLPRVAKNIS